MATDLLREGRASGTGGLPRPAATLERLFDPASVAVFGASPRRESLGGRLLGNILDGGYRGRVLAVHPRPYRMDGVRFATSLDEAVDLAVVCVPRGEVGGVLAQCAEQDVAYAAILTAGFGETDPEGGSLERRLRRVKRPRIVGPNGLGLLNARCLDGGRLAATFLELALEVRAGGVALLSQSGGCAAMLLEEARRRRLGVSKVASLGNMAGLCFKDLLPYLADDQDTRAIGIFAEDAEAVVHLRAIGKPVVVWAAGRTDAGRRAARHHTGARGWERAAASCGTVVRDTDAFFDALETCARVSLPLGSRVAVVTNSGGLGVAAADACEEAGLRVPRFAREHADQIAACLPSFGHATNPVDLTAQFQGRWARRLAALVAAEVDAVIVAIASCDYPAVVRALAEAGVPMVGVAVDAPLTARALRAAGAPVLGSVERAARALAARLGAQRR